MITEVSNLASVVCRLSRPPPVLLLKISEGLTLGGRIHSPALPRKKVKQVF